MAPIAPPAFIVLKNPRSEEESKRVPYKVSKGKNNDVTFEIRGKQVAPPEISAKVLQKLKKQHKHSNCLTKQETLSFTRYS